jgi:DNA-binding NarL/FixJ family response regulator
VSAPVRVLIVDDDALVRAGLRTMLRGTAGIEVIGEAAAGTEISRTLDHHRADVILLDIRMPMLDGLGALELVRSQPSPPAVLMLTTFDTDDHVLRALRGGAQLGTLSTREREIVEAIARGADPTRQSPRICTSVSRPSRITYRRRSESSRSITACKSP